MNYFRLAEAAIEMPPQREQPVCPECGRPLTDCEHHNHIMFFCWECKLAWLTGALAHEGVRDGIRKQVHRNGRARRERLQAA